MKRLRPALEVRQDDRGDLANFGCIELLPWCSPVESLDWPDYMVLDLDPQDVPFAQVVEVAQGVRRLLDKMGAASYCKTSGKRGLHVCVPLGGQYLFSHAKMLATVVAKLVHQQFHDITTLSPARKGLIYLDTTRNTRGQALAAPYCVRPHPGATVSTPLKWSEVRRGLDPSKFTIRTMRQRVDRLGDLWTPVVGQGIDLAKLTARF
jgi:bifunctional non-homologous end joining protein LigD